MRVDHTGTVDQIDAPHEGDVLPDFGLPRDRGHFADDFGLQGVNDGGLSGVWIADETNADLFLVVVQFGELAEEVDEGAFAEGVGERGVKGEGGVFLGEELDPTLRDPGGDEVDLVEDEDEVFVGFVLFEEFFDGWGPRAHGVAGVENLGRKLYGNYLSVCLLRS